MQPTLVKYYVFHLIVGIVHYKDPSPNDTKLAVVTLYFGVLSLPNGLMTFCRMIKSENVGKFFLPSGPHASPRSSGAGSGEQPRSRCPASRTAASSLLLPQ
jgi:hypothetical protein